MFFTASNGRQLLKFEAIIAFVVINFFETFVKTITPSPHKTDLLLNQRA